MKRSMQSYAKLSGAFLAAATIISLGVKPTDAQRPQSGSASIAQEEPIKRTVLFKRPRRRGWERDRHLHRGPCARSSRLQALPSGS